jgi:translation initiation factor IF-3
VKQERVWLAEVLDLALDLGIVVAADLLRHVSTTQLAKELPRDELARLLAAGLSEAVFAPETVVNTLGVMTLVQNLSTRELWHAIKDGIERAIDAEAEPMETTQVTKAPAEPARSAAAPKPAEPAPASKPAESPAAPAPVAAPAPQKKAPTPAPRAAPPAKPKSTLVGAKIEPSTPPRPDMTEQSAVVPPADEIDDVLTELEGKD